MTPDLQCWAAVEQQTRTERPAEPSFFDYPPDLPAELVHRWTSCDSDRLVVGDLALFLLRGCAFIGAVGSAAAGAAGAAEAWASAGWVVFFLLLWVVGQLLHIRRCRRPGAITAAEIDRVLAGRIQIDPDAWDHLPRPVEASIVHRAQAAAAQIDCCLAGPDDPKWVHLNPPEETRQIKAAAWRISEYRRQLRPDPNEIDYDPDFLAVRASVTASLDSATATLDARTAALERYAASITALAAERDRQTRLRDLRTLDDHIAIDLIPLNVTQEMAAQRIAELQDQLDALPPGRGANGK